MENRDMFHRIHIVVCFIDFEINFCIYNLKCTKRFNYCVRILIIIIFHRYNYVTDIFATNVIARDPYSGRSVQLIDRYG